ncbi:MAG: D-tyrosyl-tRNA(Tyr) deacylase [Clostridia bacterium]|nr:D-tyrosyl-tRNA(Tyr) deacylase [Clostridia bacterium]
MKAVIQRVHKATLSVEGKTVSQIGKGLVVYFCVERNDDQQLCMTFANKLAKLRIFEDEQGKMNLSVSDIGGEILFVSQFTLAADLSKGNRPSFFNAEEPSRANELYLYTSKILNGLNVPTKLGVFGADMTIEQVNNGPVTIIWENV